MEILKIKQIFKSHFKINTKATKNSKKKCIFVKNMILFMLVSKFFLNQCNVSLLLKKDFKNNTNILKAPSRHKKFFHQVTFELFTVKVIYSFGEFFKKIFLLNSITKVMFFFKKINVCFLRIGSNTLNRVKIIVCFDIKINLLPKVLLY